MDHLLIVTEQDSFYTALERRLSDCYAIRRCRSIAQVQPLVDIVSFSIMFPFSSRLI